MMKFRLPELLSRPGAPSQPELARSIGVPRQQINRLVKGDIERIDLKTLDRLYEALGCRSVDELIGYMPIVPDFSSFRERFIGQFVGLTLSMVQQNHEEMYTNPAVRQAAEEFFDRHIATDLEKGSVLASWHARLMQEMRDFVGRHGARSADGEERNTAIAQLIQEIPVEELNPSR